MAARRGRAKATVGSDAHDTEASPVEAEEGEEEEEARTDTDSEVVVLGAGGDRDPGKRILMGKAAADFADISFVTDDNPRTEDPASIRAMVMVGVPNASEVADRAEAILRAVDCLQPGDTLLIAGKGHEICQIIGEDTFPFDDVEQASIAVAALEGEY